MIFAPLSGTRKALGVIALAARAVGTGSICASVPASADIIGFANGVGYTSNHTTGTNNGLSFNGNSLTLTDSHVTEGNSAFFDTQESVSQFTASFTY